ncbi:hypothetical protein F5Y16DRAFT_378587 [Xylariaceae sp. FL0255]|nr:hypothetical protein F5Y16DRAFT_378587 [Xylariaceae sp. FL0255]
MRLQQQRHNEILGRLDQIFYLLKVAVDRMDSRCFAGGDSEYDHEEGIEGDDEEQEDGYEDIHGTPLGSDNVPSTEVQTEASSTNADMLPPLSHGANSSINNNREAEDSFYDNYTRSWFKRCARPQPYVYPSPSSTHRYSFSRVEDPDNPSLTSCRRDGFAYTHNPNNCELSDCDNCLPSFSEYGCAYSVDDDDEQVEIVRGEENVISDDDENASWSSHSYCPTCYSPYSMHEHPGAASQHATSQPSWPVMSGALPRPARPLYLHPQATECMYEQQDNLHASPLNPTFHLLETDLARTRDHLQDLLYVASTASHERLRDEVYALAGELNESIEMDLQRLWIINRV